MSCLPNASTVRVTSASTDFDRAADPVRDAAGRVRRVPAAVDRDDLQVVGLAPAARLRRSGHPAGVRPDDDEPLPAHRPKSWSTSSSGTTVTGNGSSAANFSRPVTEATSTYAPPRSSHAITDGGSPGSTTQ